MTRISAVTAFTRDSRRIAPDACMDECGSSIGGGRFSLDHDGLPAGAPGSRRSVRVVRAAPGWKGRHSGPAPIAAAYCEPPASAVPGRAVVAAKRLNAKARAGNLRNFTGVDSPYEPPDPPELRIDITALTADEAAQLIVDMLVA